MSQQKVWKGGGILRWGRWCGNSPNWDSAWALRAQTEPYASLWCCNCNRVLGGAEMNPSHEWFFIVETLRWWDRVHGGWREKSSRSISADVADETAAGVIPFFLFFKWFLISVVFLGFFGGEVQPCCINARLVTWLYNWTHYLWLWFGRSASRSKGSSSQDASYH